MKQRSKKKARTRNGEQGMRARSGEQGMRTKTRLQVLLGALLPSWPCQEQLFRATSQCRRLCSVTLRRGSIIWKVLCSNRGILSTNSRRICPGLEPGMRTRFANQDWRTRYANQEWRPRYNENSPNAPHPNTKLRTPRPAPLEQGLNLSANTE